MKRSTCVLASIGLFAASNALAAPVTDWHTLKAAPATVLSGQGTDDPILGTIATTARSSDLIGYFSPITLTNVGDSLTLSFTLSFNDAVGMVDAGDNFRFALFDSNGQTKLTDDNYALAGVDGQTDNWRGYWYGVRNGTGTGSGGSIREREAAMAAGEDNPFTNSTGSPGVSRGTVGGSAVILASSINGDNTGPTYTGTMTITKTATGNDLTGSFSGTNSANANTFAVSDNTSPFPSTFDVVGFLNGNALNADQVIFQDITVTTNVPEPTVLGLAALTAAGFAMRRRS